MHYHSLLVAMQLPQSNLLDLKKVNEHFVANHNPINPNEIDLLENNSETVNGTNQNYLLLIF